MKKLITLILSVLLICGLCTVAVAAPVDSYDINDDTHTLTIRGSIEGAGFGDIINIQVFDKGKNIDTVNSYTGDKIKSDLIYVNQLYADENGAYIININMNGKDTGFYTVRINGKETENKVYYATSNDKRMYLTQLRRLCTANEETSVVNIVKHLDLANPESKAVNMFILKDECITKADAEFLATVLYEQITKDPLSIADGTSFTTTITKSAHIAALNDGIIDVSKLETEFGFEEELTKIYKEELSSETKASFVNTYFKSKKYKTDTEIVKAYKDAVLLAFAKDFNSYGDAELIISKYGDYIGINTNNVDKLKSKYATELYTYASKLDVSSLDSFKSSVDNKVKDLLDEQKDDKSSGGGGGGGIGGGTASIPGGQMPVISQNTETAVAGYTDMADYLWAVESVNALSASGIVSGVGEGKYDPGRNVTREEILAMLLRAYGMNIDSSAGTQFTDVAQDSWYAPYVALGVNRGFINGMSTDTFGSGRFVTRQDVAVMAYRIATANGKAFPVNNEAFTDEASIADYAKEAVNALKAAGVINGMGNGSFAPEANCNRAEAAKIVYTLINQ